jgi:cytoskeletal protein RodZ
MAIDPRIALGVKNIELPAPTNNLAQYAQMQQIQSGQAEQQMNALKMQEYERTRAEEEGVRNYLSGADLTKPETQAGLLQFGKTGIAYGKALTEADTAASARQKSQFDLREAKGKFIAQAQRDTSANPSDANITAYKEDLMANPFFTDTEKTQMAAGADRILAMPVEQRKAFMASQGASSGELKPTLTSQSLGGASQIMSTPAFGGTATVVPGSLAQQQPFSPAVMEQKGLLATKGAPKTAINLGGGKYAEAVGGGMGKADVEKYDFAQTIPAALTKVNETLDILKNSDINTGLGAELLTTLDRAKAKFTADKASNIRVSNTEYLSSLLGSEVFPLIQSLGIGARGIDTPAEKEYLLDVMTGRVSLNKDTLIRMTENRKKSMLGTAEQYNRNVDSGELDKFFEASGRIKSRIDIPKAPPKPGAAAAAAAAQIPGQTASPAGVSVTLPNGQSVSFPNAAAAAQFKKAAGL